MFEKEDNEEEHQEDHEDDRDSPRADAASQASFTRPVAVAEAPRHTQVYKMRVIVEVVDKAGLLTLSEKLGRSEADTDEGGNQSYGVMDALEDVTFSSAIFTNDCFRVREIDMEDSSEQQAAEDARMMQWHAEHPRSVGGPVE